MGDGYGGRMRTVRQYINEFDPEWDVRGVGEWKGNAVIWMMTRGDPAPTTASPQSSRHYISRFDGVVILEEEWAEEEEIARELFREMCGATEGEEKSLSIERRVRHLETRLNELEERWEERWSRRWEP